MPLSIDPACWDPALAGGPHGQMYLCGRGIHRMGPPALMTSALRGSMAPSMGLLVEVGPARLGAGLFAHLADYGIRPSVASGQVEAHVEADPGGANEDVACTFDRRRKAPAAGSRVRPLGLPAVEFCTRGTTSRAGEWQAAQRRTGGDTAP